MSKTLQSFLKVVSSNFIVMILGIISTLLIPGLLGPYEYGQWQLYLLYSSYVGLLILGFNDGIYLMNGGKNYKNLIFGNLSFNFFILSIYTITVSIISIVLILIFIEDPSKQFTYISVSISIILQCINSFFVLINQATSRFTIFSVVNIVEKVFFVILIVLFVFIDIFDFKVVITISLFSKLIVLILNIIADYQLVFSKPLISVKSFKNLKLYIIAGLPLTLAGITGMLINGIGRFTVESNFGIVEFGYYSFAFSILGIITQLITAASIVIYPVLTTTPKEKIIDISKIFEKILEYSGAILNLIYYPMVIFVTFLLPDYTAAISVILFLFPMLIYQSRISIIYNTIYKVMRWEKQIFLNSIFTLVFTTLITMLFYTLDKSLVSISFATLFSYIFLSFLSKYFLYKKTKEKMIINKSDLFVNSVFIILNLTLPLITSFLLYSIFILGFLLYKKSEIVNLFTIIKSVR